MTRATVTYHGRGGGPGGRQCGGSGGQHRSTALPELPAPSAVLLPVLLLRSPLPPSDRLCRLPTASATLRPTGRRSRHSQCAAAALPPRRLVLPTAPIVLATLTVLPPLPPRRCRAHLSHRARLRTSSGLGSTGAGCGSGEHCCNCCKCANVSTSLTSTTITSILL